MKAHGWPNRRILRAMTHTQHRERVRSRVWLPLLGLCIACGVDGAGLVVNSTKPNATGGTRNLSGGAGGTTGGNKAGSGGTGQSGGSTAGSGGAAITGGTKGTGGQSPGTCVPQTETCNGRDDNCDQTIDDNAGCPFIPQYFEKHAYLFVPMLMTWADAESYCESQGYTLVSINNENESRWFDEQVRQLQRTFELARSPWWMGYTDEAVEGKWVWSDGSNSGFTAWAEGKPNNRDRDGHPENCGAIEGSTNVGRWNDVGCELELPFACEAGR